MSEKIKSDSVEIVRRLKERNPNFLEQIQDENISLEDFAEVAITQFLAFNNIKVDEKIANDIDA